VGYPGYIELALSADAPARDFSQVIDEILFEKALLPHDVLAFDSK